MSQTTIRLYTITAAAHAILSGLYPSSDKASVYDREAAKAAGMDVTVMGQGHVIALDYSVEYSDLMFPIPLGQSSASIFLDRLAMMCMDFNFPFMFMSGDVMKSDFVCFGLIVEDLIPFSEQMDHVNQPIFKMSYLGSAQGARLNQLFANQNYDLSMLEGTQSEKMEKLYRSAIEYLFIMQSIEYNELCNDWMIHFQQKDDDIQVSSLLSLAGMMILNDQDSSIVLNHQRMIQLLNAIDQTELPTNFIGSSWLLNHRIPKSIEFALMESKNNLMATNIVMDLIAYALEAEVNNDDATGMIDDAFELMRKMQINVKRDFDCRMLLEVVENPSPHALRHLIEHPSFNKEDTALPAILRSITRGYRESNQMDDEDVTYLIDLAKHLFQRQEMLNTINTAE